MFSWPELLLIAIIAVVIIGPKDLPRLMRQCGLWARKARLVVAEFQRHWDDIPNQVDLLDMQKQADDLQQQGYKKYDVDPFADAAEDDAAIQENVQLESKNIDRDKDKIVADKK